MTPYVLELLDYSLAPIGSGHGVQQCYFALTHGDVCAINAPSVDDGNLFLRALATLVRPVKGTYIFKGRKHDSRRYGEMLCCKQKIGYAAPEAALISNLTVRQNLLLQRYYHENNLAINLDEKAMALCADFGIADKLDKRPAGLNAMEARAAIIIRELAKKPDLMLLDHPENFVGHARFEVMARLFNQLVTERLPIVFLSHDERLLGRYVNRKVIIANGSLTTVDMQGASVENG